MRDLIEKIREYQYENKFTAAEMGALLDCNSAYLTNVLNGARNAGPSLKYRMIKLLELSTTKSIHNKCENEKHEHQVNPSIADECASEICVTIKPQKKLIPKIAHNLLHVQLQGKTKGDLIKAKR